MTTKNILVILLLIAVIISIIATTLILDSLTEKVDIAKGTGQVRLYVMEKTEEKGPTTGLVTLNVIEKRE